MAPKKSGMDWLTQLKPGMMDTDLTDEGVYALCVCSLSYTATHCGVTCRVTCHVTRKVQVTHRYLLSGRYLLRYLARYVAAST